MKSEYAAFLASRMTDELKVIRENVYVIGQESRRHVWVAGKSDQELDGTSFDETQIICLEKVRHSERLICVLDGTYGTAQTSWNPSEISILELEIAMAMLAQKPIHIFLLEPRSKHYIEDKRLSSFLKVVRAVYPKSIIERTISEKDIISRIEMIIENDRGVLNKIKNIFGSLLQWLYEIRRRRRICDLRFLDAEFASVISERPDEMSIEKSLRAADEAPDMPTKLAKLWMCFRSLSAVPYTIPGFSSYLPFWKEMFSKWASASAWFALHGHFLLGRLAAANSLGEVINILGADKNLSPEDAKEGVHGAIASEYYSMAKLVPSGRYKKLLLNEALSNLGNALSYTQGDISGLLSIRGSVLLELGDVRAAVSEYERSLQVRLDAKEPLGRIGEAEAYLGFGYFRLGINRLQLRYIWKAQELLEAGVHHLKDSNRVPFTVGAMKKLCLFYTATLQWERARIVFDEAYELANRHGLYGQVQYLNTLKKLLRK